MTIHQLIRILERLPQDATICVAPTLDTNTFVNDVMPWVYSLDLNNEGKPAYCLELSDYNLGDEQDIDRNRRIK